MVDGLDDLFLGVASVAQFVGRVGERVLVGDMFPQTREVVGSVADITENTTRQQGVIAQLPGRLHFPRLF